MKSAAPQLFLFGGRVAPSKPRAYTCTVLRSLAPPARAGVVQCRCRDHRLQEFAYYMLISIWGRNEHRRLLDQRIIY